MDFFYIFFFIFLGVFHILKEAADAAKSAMVSVIGLDSDKVQQLCDAANHEVDNDNKVQIANYLCTVSFSDPSFNNPNCMNSCQSCILFDHNIYCLGKLCCIWRFKGSGSSRSQGKII